MRKKLGLIVFGLLFTQPLTLAGAAKQEPQSLPDLVVKEIVFEQPSKVRVRIVNQGQGSAATCYLALQILANNGASLKTEQRVWTIQIPALDAGKGYSNVIDVSPLSRTDGAWKATVDRSNFVKESNEDNNSLDYPRRNPGPFPPRRFLADLTINQFSLDNPYKGVVGVIVSNTGSVASVACTLRLIVWEAGKFEQKEAKTVFVKVPAIPAGKTARVTAIAGVSIMSTKYSLYIDIGNDVAESDEKNNRAEGEAGKY